MAWYLIKGYDNIFNGSHGMIKSEIVNCNDDQEAVEWAYALAQEVVEDYSAIYNFLEEDVKEICIDEGINYEEDGPAVDDIRDGIYEEDYKIEVGLLDETLLPDIIIDSDVLEDMYWEDEEKFEKLYVLKWI